jgi:hypothetical protein
MASHLNAERDIAFWRATVGGVRVTILLDFFTPPGGDMGFSIGGLFKSIGNAVSGAVKDVEQGVETAAKDVEGFVSKEAKAVSNLFSGAPKDSFEPAPPTSNQQFKTLNEPLFKGTPTDDFSQGSIGDCYVLSSLAAVVLNNPQTIENNIKDNGNGTYTVTLHLPPGFGLAADLGSTGLKIEGGIDEALDALGISPPTSTVQVTVDAKVPVDANGKPVAVNSSELWPEIYEKAIAQVMKGYPNMGNGGIPAMTLQMITGKSVKTHPMFDNSASDIYNDIVAAAKNKQPMTASTSSNPGGGLAGNHVYAVLGAYTQNGQQYVTVRNPWGGANNGVQNVPLSTFMSAYEEVDVGNT